MLATLGAGPAQCQTLDPRPLWRFDDPALSQSQFEAVLARPGLHPDDALILRTQVARSRGLRGDFEGARGLLAAQGAARDRAGPQAQAHWHLEWGRSWCSAAHPEAALTPDARAAARQAYGAALALADQAGADELAVDALHMMAFVEADPPLAQAWTERALARAQASARPAAQRWVGSLQHNLGVGWMAQGRPAQALAAFEAALAARRAQAATPPQLRQAESMVGWALRGLGRWDEAWALQQRLAQENDRDGSPDPEVWDEIAELAAARGRPEAADQARQRAAALREHPTGGR